LKAGEKWDFKDTQGIRVKAGLYFARFRGIRESGTLRAWVF